MLKSFNYEAKELLATNQYLIIYIDSVDKERAAYPEENTLHFKNVAKITVDSYSITPQKIQNGKEEDRQENVRSHSTKMRKIRV